MQIPILSGIYTDEDSEYRTSYPVNLVPVPKNNGVSTGYLRPAEGITAFSPVAPGVDRGGINWNGTCYRVMGTKFGSIDNAGNFTEIGDVGGSGQVKMDYGFDYLGIASSGSFYLYDGTTLAQNTDPDLGVVKDFIWVDGYFMTTDGQFLVVTELNDPFSVNPLKYGSSEADPDGIIGLMKIRREVYVLNRNSIEVFYNAGGDLFPFQRISGAQMIRGAIGPRTSALFMESCFFLGGGKNEAPAIWAGVNANTTKVSTREIDLLLQQYPEVTLNEVLMETKVDKSHQHLYVHLPDRTLVYDGGASQALGQPVWFILTSGITGFNQYRAKNLVYCYNKWIVGDPTSNKLGYLTESHANHYGDKARWEFSTAIIYNDGFGAQFHQLELVSLTGRADFGKNPKISTSYSLDGETWGQNKFISVGTSGDRLKRLVWLQQGSMRNWRIQRFDGDSDSFISISRLEAKVEPLAF